MLNVNVSVLLKKLSNKQGLFNTDEYKLIEHKKYIKLDFKFFKILGGMSTAFLKWYYRLTSI